jgi:hypothetical protein
MGSIGADIETERPPPVASAWPTGGGGSSKDGGNCSGAAAVLTPSGATGSRVNDSELPPSSATGAGAGAGLVINDSACFGDAGKLMRLLDGLSVGADGVSTGSPVTGLGVVGAKNGRRAASAGVGFGMCSESDSDKRRARANNGSCG